MTQIANTDIDLDFADKDRALRGLEHIPAVIMNARNGISRHASGVYFQNIPTNPMTGMSAFEYQEAEKLGYFKIDFLNQSVYSEVRDEEHLNELLNREPIWELLEEEVFVAKLMHIGEHFNIVKVIQPRSIDDLAVVLALIRPGQKHLLHAPRSLIDQNIWIIDKNAGYQFKKTHAISYATLIVVHMNLLVEEMLRAPPDDLITI